MPRTDRKSNTNIDDFQAVPQEKRLDRLQLITFTHGSHTSINDGGCAMEWAAWVAGEKHSDRPACVSPVIAAFGRAWNDALPTDADRDRLLKPLVPLMIGTRTGPEDDETRAWLATDWLVRVQAPAWMSLTEVLRGHADLLRGLPAITSTATAEAAKPMLTAAWAAAGAAAWAAAWAAAGAALAPTVATLQESAVALVVAMCAVGRVAE
ncbi:MAG TPA: hypothetical protein VNM48_09070 [Chloroflexota bacterium]|nr:hypothetical protein [Chloroflexota bacterium]